MNVSLRQRVCVVFTIITLTAGCSRFPKGPDRPDWSPDQSAAEAMKLYDSNSDGFVDKTEVKASPGLEDAFERVDKDSDKKLSQQEIADRIRYYSTAATTILTGSTEVTLNGRPLSDATVVFEPEPFLGPAFKECRGVTDSFGVASVSGHDAKFPGIYLGFYRVRITKEVSGRESIPAKYNTDTSLGYEGADDIPMVSHGIRFTLKK